MNVSGNRAEIANLSGTAGGGKISASGFVSYGQETTFNLGLSAQSVRIRYPEGLRSILSGQINMRGNPGDSTLTGASFGGPSFLYASLLTFREFRGLFL